MDGLWGTSSPPVSHPTHSYIRKPLAHRELLPLNSLQFNQCLSVISSIGVIIYYGTWETGSVECDAVTWYIGLLLISIISSLFAFIMSFERCSVDIQVQPSLPAWYLNPYYNLPKLIIPPFLVCHIFGCFRAHTSLIFGWMVYSDLVVWYFYLMQRRWSQRLIPGKLYIPFGSLLWEYMP